jgi:outer membrane receptor protein involved in Fe transport
MKYLIVFFLLIFVSVPLPAQNKTAGYQVSGQMVNKISGDGIPYATIVLKSDSIKVKKMLACSVSGQFSINVDTPGNYILITSATGYKEFSMPVDVSGLKTDLGKISMEEGAIMKEVVVSAQKPLVKMDLDKIVYSIESDPEAQTNNAFEMLRKIPLVTVDAEDNVLVNGQSNFKVLVNGKSSAMMSSNFKDVLKSLPANTIKDIEVITNPSSKYDAEGVGGILNIITNKKTISGYNGSVNAGVNTRGSINAGVYLATKIKKLSFAVRYYGSQYIQPKMENSTASEYFNNTEYHYLNSDGNNSYKGTGNGFSGEASYDIDSLDLISLSFWGYQGSYNSDGFNETRYLSTANDITRMYTSTTNTREGYGSLSGNIDYQKTYKKPDKSLTFSYKLDNNPNTTKYTSDNEGMINYPTYSQRSANDAVGREQTFQADYYDPLTKMHQIEGGVKFILRQNTSSSDTYRNDTLDTKRGNDLDYNQYIMGAYAGYVLKLEKFGIRTGLRLERTWNDGESKIAGTTTDFTNRLINLIPYITFSYMPKTGQTIKLSYTKRLSRPGIWYLNPYVNDADSLNVSYGNPSLVAEVANSFELGYTFFTPKLNLSASSDASFVNNSIENISKVQSNGATFTTYENIGKNLRFGLNLYFSYRPTQKLSIYFNGSGSYSKLETNNGYPISNKGFSYNSFLSARMTLWKDGSVNLYTGIYSPGIMLQGKSSSYYYTSFGVSQYFLKRKLQLSLSASDPFWRSKKYTSDLKDITFKSHNVNTYLSRMARFNVTFNFGKMDLQVKKVNRGIQNDDVKSGGGHKEGSGQ